MSKKRTIRFSDDLDKFLETHAEKNKRSFSKTVEYFVEVGKETEKLKKLLEPRCKPNSRVQDKTKCLCSGERKKKS